MESIKISSVDLSPLKSFSKYIQLDFEGYDKGEECSYPCSILLDTETNMAVKHPDTDTQSIKFAFTKNDLNIVLYTTCEENGEYDGICQISQINGGWDNEGTWFLEFHCGPEDSQNLNQNEIGLLTSVFTEESIYKIIHDVIDVTNNL